MPTRTPTPIPLWIPWSFFGLGCVAMADSALCLFDREGPRYLAFLLASFFAFLAYKIFQATAGAFRARRDSLHARS